MNTKLHFVTDANGRPPSFLMTAGETSDYTGAAVLLDDLPKAQWLLRTAAMTRTGSQDALQQKGIKPAFMGANPVSIPSDTTSVATNAAIV